MKIIGDYIMRSIAGETVLVPTGKTAQEHNGMITMNEVAKFIWENMERVDSRQELATLLTEEFEVDYEVAFRDVTMLVRELYQHGLVAPTKEDQSW